MKQTHRPLDYQVAIVTGATSGIGRGIAKALAEAGATVAINHRGHDDDAQQLIAEIEDAGGAALALRADVAVEADVVRMFDELTDRQGRVDILVANAGVQRDAPFAEMTLEQWQAVIDVNLTGQFLCCREAVRRFLRQPPPANSKAAGKIINISSVHELIPWAGHVNYAASKGGIMQLMKSLAQEVADKRIRVNGIAPGAIKTPINEDAWADEDALQKLLTLIPYGRIGEVEDVARAAVWLACDDSDYVTGTTLFVDGGMSLYPAFRDNG